MFGVKIILTVIIVLALAVMYLGTNPAVTGIFDSVRERAASFIGDNAQRSLEFSLVADKSPDFSFSSSASDIVVTGSTRAALSTGVLHTNKTLGIYGFHGSGSVSGMFVKLSGGMERVDLPDIEVDIKENMKLNSTFSSLSIYNISAGEIRIEDTAGLLSVRGTTTEFSGNITIKLPSGDFEFSDNSFSVSGKASKISIPSSGISIG